MRKNFVGKLGLSVKFLQKIVLFLWFFVMVSGCQSIELSQVDAGAPERPINSPEQARQLAQEHTP
jgi:hypothetical protein